MINLKTIVTFGIVLCAIFLQPLMGIQTAHAVSTDALNISTSCPQTEHVSYSGQLTVAENSYDIYVRLPKVGQSAGVTLYYQASLGDDCHTVGSANASGDTWTKIGSVGDLDPSTPAIFQLSSDGLGTTLDANRPSVMLVSTVHPACVPTTECYVTVGGQQGYVRAPGTLPTEDSLHIVSAIDPASDTVKDVTYYTDDTVAYTSPALKAFDLRYASEPDQKLTRVVEYQSGQLVVLQSQTADDFVPSFGATLFRLFLSHATLTWIYAAGITVIILAAAGLGILHSYRTGHRWLYHYKDMQRYQAYLKLSKNNQEKADKKHRATQSIKYGLFGTLYAGVTFILVVTINTYGATFYQVNGHSMDSTFTTGNEEFVNKLPVTLAHLKGTQFIPKRGTVVILHAIYGIGESDSLTPEGDIIKRVIGLPGEHVVVHTGTITVYNADHPGGFDPDNDSPWQATMHAGDPNESIDVTLKENELFISGDNRPVSIDSRFNGPITTDEIVGVVEFKLF